MNSKSQHSREVELLAEDFLEKHRAGDHPSIESYCTRHPQHASEIREVFEALLLVEDLKPQTRDDPVRPSEPTPSPKLPTQVGGYRILREVGRGGMGVVYEAEQESLNRRVALKVLAHNGQRGEQAAARFDREARAAARMHHTNIVPVFEVGTDNDYMFYAMQLIDGQGLDEVINYIRQLREEAKQAQLAKRADLGRSTVDESEVRTDEVSTLMGSESLSRDPSNGPQFDHGSDQPTIDLISDQVESPQRSPSPLTPKVDDQKTRFDETSSVVSGILPGQSEQLSTTKGRSEYHNRVAQIGLQTARALAYAHTRDVIHRDIKPSNLILDRSGTVWVTDFGLAKTNDQAMTQTGDILGTLRYMSPERFKGQCDARADIYSLGITLYELLLLRPAFASADRMQLIEMVTSSTPAKPRSIDPDIPRDFETIVLKCADSDPRRRYQSAEELAHELTRFLAGEPIHARPISNVERATRWCRRNQMLATLASLAVISLLAGTITSTVFAVLASQNASAASQRAQSESLERERANDNARKASEREKLANSLLAQVNVEKQRSESKLRLAQRLLNLNRIQSAQREWQSLHAAAAWKHLDAYRGDQYDWEHRYLYNLFSRNYTTLSGHADDVNAIAISPDGRRMVSAAGGRWKGAFVPEVGLWDLESGRMLMTLRDHHHIVMDVAFSPDGSRFASAGLDWNIRIHDADSGQTVLELIAGQGSNAVEFSHRGNYIAAGCMDGVVRVWDAETGDLVRSLEGHTEQVTDLEFSPDDRTILTGSSDKTMKLWDTETGETIRRYERCSSAVYSVSFNSNGSRIVSGHWDSTIQVWATESTRPLRTLQGHRLAVYSAGFSPDDQLIVSGSYDQKIKLWDAADGSELRSYEGHTGTVYQVEFHQQGERLVSASGDKTVRIWDANDLRQTLTTDRHETVVTAIGFSPDGKQLVSSGGKLRLFDVQSGTQILQFEDSHGCSNVAFGPLGDRVYCSGAGNAFTIWEVQTGRKIRSIESDQYQVSSMALSRDGRKVALGSTDGAIRVIDADTGEQLQQIEHGADVKAVCFSVDGQRIFAGCLGGRIAAWDTAKGTLIKDIYKGAAVYAMALSDDGRRLATGGPVPTINVWDTKSGDEVTALQGSLIQIYALDFNSDGSRLVAGGSDNSLEFWDLEHRTVSLTLDGHQDAVVAAAFSPDGTRVASGSRDATVKFWDASDAAMSSAYNKYLASNRSLDSGLQWISADQSPCPPSPDAAAHSMVVIENRRAGAIALYWSDDQGNRIDWGMIQSGARKRLSTYSAHCWLIVDDGNRELGHLIAGQRPGVATISATGVVISELVQQPPEAGSDILAEINSNLSKEPANHQMLATRGMWFGGRGRWAESIRDLDQACRLNPRDLVHACYLGPLIAWKGKPQAWREHCESMLKTWGDSTEPRTCERVAKTCLVYPDIVDPQAIERLTEIALSVGEDYEYHQYNLMLKGLNACRNGRFDEAIAACRESRRRSPGGGTLSCTNHAIESLAHYHQGRLDQAKESHAAAKQLFDTVLPAPRNGDDPGWPDWVIARLLFEEAGALIQSETQIKNH